MSSCHVLDNEKQHSSLLSAFSLPKVSTEYSGHDYVDLTNFIAINAHLSMQMGKSSFFSSLPHNLSKAFGSLVSSNNLTSLKHHHKYVCCSIPDSESMLAFQVSFVMESNNQQLLTLLIKTYRFLRILRYLIQIFHLLYERLIPRCTMFFCQGFRSFSAEF